LSVNLKRDNIASLYNENLSTIADLRYYK